MAWELRTASPMLDLSLFRNPRFSIGSLSISLAFFSLFGAIFALTQFLQFAKDYSPLEAGAAMVPLAFGLMLGATRSPKLVERFGHHPRGGRRAPGPRRDARRRRCCGRATCPTGRSACGSSAWRSRWAASWGPATHSVMGAVPKEKAGVASAMNDVTRQVGGALGTAVIGSLVASFYGSRVADAASGLPSGTQDAVKDSIGGADAVAAQLPADQGSSLAHSAASAFTDALGLGLCAASVAAFVAAVVVIRRLPARARRRDPERASHGARRAGRGCGMSRSASAPPPPGRRGRLPRHRPDLWSSYDHESGCPTR